MEFNPDSCQVNSRKGVQSRPEEEGPAFIRKRELCSFKIGSKAVHIFESGRRTQGYTGETKKKYVK